MSRVQSTILVVDDDDDVRDLAMYALERDGHLVIGARNGVEALDLIDQHPEIDLLFTDVVMPGIDGIMLADMIKTHRPRIKVVYATGYHDLARSLPGIIHGVMLDKPYRPDRLQMEINAALEAEP